MKRQDVLALMTVVATVPLALPALAANGHYVPGVEGLNGPVVPPPGFYYRGYLVHYDINSLRDASGDSVLGDNSGEVTALANRFIWMTGKKFLGADYGIEAIVPVQRTSLDFAVAGIDESESGVGDVFLGPVVLGWHGERWDTVFAAGYWFDSGDYAADQPASIGKGFGSTMLTLGGTWHFDAAKTWSFSALSRYEIHGEQDETGITPGDSLVVEWGLGHRLGNGLSLGLVGYDAWQVESDSGLAPGAPSAKAEQHAVGAEAGYFWPALGLGLNAAYYHEYDNRNRPEGDLMRLTLTKGF